MREVITAVFLLIGATFMLLAAVGVLRMPDLFTRMQAATKATALGSGFLLVAAPIYFAELGVAARALAVVAFIVLTAPVAAHMIARAAYFISVPLWEKTFTDELRGKYEPTTHILLNVPDPSPDDRQRT